MTLPIALRALPPQWDDLERLALMVETDPAGLAVTEIRSAHDDALVGLRLRHSDLRVQIATLPDWPVGLDRPSAVAALMRALAADAEANDHPKARHGHDQVARHAETALALHEAEHGPFARPVSVETCLSEGRPLFYVENRDHIVALDPDMAILTRLRGRMTVPFHCWEAVADDDGEDVLHVGPSLSEDQGDFIEPRDPDPVEILRIHAALAERGPRSAPTRHPEPFDLDEDAFLAGDGDPDVDDVFAKDFERVLAEMRRFAPDQLEPTGLPDVPSLRVDGVILRDVACGVLALSPAGEPIGGHLSCDLSVAPEWRGRGLGAELVVERCLRHGGNPVLDLDVAAYSRAGIAAHRSAWTHARAHREETAGRLTRLGLDGPRT